RVAKLDREGDRVEISRGVALAFECRDGNYAPCENASATADDTRIAQILPAHLNDVSEPWDWGGPNPKTAFVVVGVAAGTTKLRVHYGKGTGSDGSLIVTVLDDPAPSAGRLR